MDKNTKNINSRVHAWRLSWRALTGSSIGATRSMIDLKPAGGLEIAVTRLASRATNEVIELSDPCLPNYFVEQAGKEML